ncbi:MAG: OmpH family outer membrane protein [Spirochaetota bacterium]|nr:MAG: OmpH family outer membrane protein [Spirochaetota bacterium]
MNKRLIIFLLNVTCLVVPFMGHAKTSQYVKVGYINLDRIIQTYTAKYLEAEIKLIENSISQLPAYSVINYLTLTEKEKSELQSKLQDYSFKLETLKSNKYFWNVYGEFMDDTIYDKIQKDIMEAIRKVSILEGYSMVLDSTDNFVYGSEDVNLTEKVLFRLDEKLLKLEINENENSIEF